eukprot:5686422-Lingulodinium_polyedra.AAC.1
MAGIPLGHVERFLLGALQPATVVKYMRALDSFNNDLEARGLCWQELAEAEQDLLIADQLVEWADGEGLYSQGALLLAAAAKVQPRARFTLSWKVLDVWRQRVPP